MVLRARKATKEFLFLLYKLGIRLGFYVVPVHYYAPNINMLELENTIDQWAHKSELPGLDIDIDCQLATLRSFLLPYMRELADHALYRAGTGQQIGPGYGEENFSATYCVLRTIKPSRVIEIGSGVSTYGTLAALKRNTAELGTSASLVAIEPFPNKRLRALDGVSLIEAPVQSVPIRIFLELEENDLLFIDSSHMVKSGSDVNFLILEVLPRLKPGVIIHFDDIHLPYDHGPSILTHPIHFSETSMLRAFLINNKHAEILFSLRMLYYERLKALVSLFPDFEPGEVTEQGLYPKRYGIEGPRGSRPGAMFIRIV